ncbi:MULTISPECIES: hypothetical protein [unclassified Microcoleus]|uniref:hypothetical protein n=1 Tax=unclassified Microcoleus TaxID=2642155 RepID=UPI001DB4F433|nr:MULTISPECIES: hypothetical protein [unclassified Microcoleus]MCC3506725.1 hypothetical protein [Microcoleus sp. PH2017_19_SFW_U_A]MCC3526079.1 hypothetical protein [Microcoleus sp. PH2017_20_SFW_D_A]MCC3547116.1 hypothetical protein [Microcoleus sp. PH2017_24_DOB_U_A]MCC3557108.1 hypothetical protein [Microcoleus sp. PH2017_35_SFW_U_B]MCC3569726.1 hypothetical protein [Microcoleus sp. PH2017_31_RDM_U_A]
MNSLILISPEQAWGFQPILSGKFLFPSFTDYRLGKNLKQSAILGCPDSGLSPCSRFEQPFMIAFDLCSWLEINGTIISG